MSNLLSPENEFRPSDDRGLAAATGASNGAPSGLPPPSSGFDIGAAAAAVIAAAAQPVEAASEPTWSAPYEIDPSTGYSIDPNTGYLFEPTTGYFVDPTTGYLLDPSTGYPFDPNTGHPIDPNATDPAAAGGEHASAGLAPESEMPVAEEPPLAAPPDVWETLPTAWEPPPEVHTSAREPGAPELEIAEVSSTSMWDLGGPASPCADPTAPGLPAGWPGGEEATRLDDLCLESGGSFAVAGDARVLAEGTLPAMAELPAFELGAAPADAPPRAEASAPDAVGLSEPEILLVLEEDILEDGAEDLTVDEVEILAAPEQTPAPATDPAAFVAGKHRVVVHTADGQVKRGAMMDAALDGSEVVIEAQAGSGHEVIPSNRIKAIFFMLPTGETPPPPQGVRVRVTFRDGRQVVGFSPDYDPKRVGFFMVPADTRTHTARIWVCQSAVRQVAVI
jgi:hypothetical protein